MSKKAVMVTTVHKGVFFGYANGDMQKDSLTLTDARNCIYWSADVKGFLGLAASGPTGSCKIGPKVPSLKSDKDGRAANGGKSDPVHVGLVQTVPGPLRLCQPGTLHATYRLDKWNGERIWLVALSGEVKEDDDKLGALQREFIAELTGGKIQ